MPRASPSPCPRPTRLIAQYPFELLFTPDRVTVFYEVFGSLRRIPFAIRATPFDALPSAMGTSNGHWEGDTLVVETHAHPPRRRRQANGDAPISNARRIVERYFDGQGRGRQQAAAQRA